MAAANSLRQAFEELESNRLAPFVKLLEEADAMVSARPALKGTAYRLYDVLTEDEQQAHNLLWPEFLKAQEQGKLAQFDRARLRVSGVEVLPCFPTALI